MWDAFSFSAVVLMQTSGVAGQDYVLRAVLLLATTVYDSNFELKARYLKVMDYSISQLSAMDVSAQATMKGAAKCDNHCELQNSENQ